MLMKITKFTKKTTQEVFVPFVVIVIGRSPLPANKVRTLIYE
jgi:hypothetical protein